MGITQSDINALMGAAEELSAEAGGPPQAAPVEPSPEPSAPPSRAPSAGSSSAPETQRELNRILHLSVPVIVKLAEQEMPVGKILNINVGSIIEFDRPFDAELDLIASNCRIAIGQAVKVGENFGLRITQIGDLNDKVKALGG